MLLSKSLLQFCGYRNPKFAEFLVRGGGPGVPAARGRGSAQHHSPSALACGLQGWALFVCRCCTNSNSGTGQVNADCLGDVLPANLLPSAGNYSLPAKQQFLAPLVATLLHDLVRCGCADQPLSGIRASGACPARGRARSRDHGSSKKRTSVQGFRSECLLPRACCQPPMPSASPFRCRSQAALPTTSALDLWGLVGVRRICMYVCVCIYICMCLSCRF